MTLEALADFLHRQMGWTMDVGATAKDLRFGPAKWEGTFQEVIASIAADYGVAASVDDAKKAISFHRP